MNVFDRNAKRLQRNRTAQLLDYHVYDYLKDEVRVCQHQVPCHYIGCHSNYEYSDIFFISLHRMCYNSTVSRCYANLL